MKKICSICKKEKDISEFNKKTVSKDGLDTKCRDCQKAYDKSRKEIKKLYDKQYKQNNEDKIKKYSEIYEKRPNRIKQKKINSKIWRENNKDKLRENNKKYRQTEIGKICLQKQNYNRKLKYHNDISYRLNRIFSVCVSKTIKKQNFDSKYLEWDKNLNYTAKELKQHLESQFTSEMTWDNYSSYWEIDHIIPKNQFNFENYTDKEFQICWSLANLRPLTVSENLQRPKDGSDISEELKNSILNQIF